MFKINYYLDRAPILNIYLNIGFGFKLIWAWADKVLINVFIVECRFLSTFEKKM